MTTATLSNGKQFVAPAGVSLLDAAKHAGLVLAHSCRIGRCGTCKARVVEGKTVALLNQEALVSGDSEAGWVLTCACAATTDLQLDLEDLGPLADIPVKTLPCRIAALERPAADVLKVALRLPPNSNFRYLPGQYVNVIAPGGIHRSYSIGSADDGSGRFELHIRRIDGGSMSRYWFEQAKLNDLLRIEGPRGTFFLREVAGLDLVFLATGTGIAPFGAMLAELAARPRAAQAKSVSLYWGGRKPADIYWRPSHESLRLKFVPTLSRADAHWTGARGYVQQTLIESSPSWDRTVVYACGSNTMIESARSSLTTAGLPQKRFFSDAFLSSS